MGIETASESLDAVPEIEEIEEIYGDNSQDPLETPDIEEFPDAGKIETIEDEVSAEESLELEVGKAQEAVEWAERVVSQLGSGGSIERKKAQREILVKFYLSDTFSDNMRKRGDISGHVFEELALSSMGAEESEHVALGRFLLETLRNPNRMEIELDSGLESLSPEKQILYRDFIKYERGKLPVRNPDIIKVRVRTDPNTGARCATIIGVTEVKNHKVSGSGHTSAGDDLVDQLKESAKNLHENVERYKRIFPLYVEIMGLTGILPENIDCLSPEELEKRVIMPENTLPPRIARNGKFEGVRFSTIPFNRNELKRLCGIIERS